MERGKVKWYDDQKKYGFIRSDKNVEYFVHSSDIVGYSHLEKDQHVEFEVANTDRGPKATNVRSISAGSPN